MKRCIACCVPAAAANGRSIIPKQQQRAAALPCRIQQVANLHTTMHTHTPRREQQQHALRS
jgi:hypothetical protein